MSKSENLFTSPERGYIEVPTQDTHKAHKDHLSTQIVMQLERDNFDTIIFDFDGTLTKYHSHRSDNRSRLGNDGNWFADKDLLEQILVKGNYQGISFYIASKQGKTVIENILQAHNLDHLFTNIFGSGIEKETAISQISEQEENKKILYFDDDPEKINPEKITIIRGLLQRLPSSPSARPSESIEGEAGLDYDKWQETLSCLRTHTYDIRKRSATPDIDFPSLSILTSPPSSVKANESLDSPAKRLKPDVSESKSYSPT